MVQPELELVLIRPMIVTSDHTAVEETLISAAPHDILIGRKGDTCLSDLEVGFPVQGFRLHICDAGRCVRCRLVHSDDQHIARYGFSVLDHNKVSNLDLHAVTVSAAEVAAIATAAIASAQDKRGEANGMSEIGKGVERMSTKTRKVQNEQESNNRKHTWKGRDERRKGEGPKGGALICCPFIV